MQNIGPDDVEKSPWVRLETVTSTGSTQSDLLAQLQADPQAWPHLSALRALHQRAGRGRSNHSWDTPPSGALTFSAVLRPCVPPAQLAWAPLIAGLAVRDAVAATASATGLQLGWEVGLKWPNDVIVRPVPAGSAWPAHPGWEQWRKVAGILTDLVSDPLPGDERADALIVVGIGVNVAQTLVQLPVPWATSLREIGLETNAAALLDGIGEQLDRRFTQWERTGDPATSALGETLRANCWSLSQEIDAETPQGSVHGRAVDLTPALLLETPTGRFELTAGDTTIRRTADYPFVSKTRFN